MRKHIFKGLSAIVLALTIVVLAGEAKGEAFAAGYTSQILSCAITEDQGSVGVVASIPAGQASDDGIVYLFSMPTYAAGLTGEPLAAVPIAGQVVLSTPLQKDAADSKLYHKFALAVKSGGAFVQITETCYILNPEAVATNSMSYPEGAPKKGLLVSPTQYTTGEIADVGVKQTTYDIPVNRLFGSTTNSSYPTVNFKYNGKNYQFDGFVVAQYDHVFKALTNQGVIVSAILLNELDPTCMQTTHPLARTQTTSPYYMFNAADQSGVEHLAAAGAFLAQRYSTGSNGKVHNWIIGNEISAKDHWNYIAPMDVVTYTEEYAKALRVFYTAIKSKNANARIFISLDQTWDRNENLTTGYDSRDIIDALASHSNAKGNFDWGVAIHPYPVPLTWPMFWSMPPEYAALKLVQQKENTPMVTVANINVFTDYMCKPENLTRTGQVRPLMVSEVGFPSAQGEHIQAAAISYAYYNCAVYNQHIDAFILARDIDSATEVAQGLNMGLKNADGSRKAAYDIYKNIDGGNSLGVTEFAKGVIGISDWSQVIYPR